MKRTYLIFSLLASSMLSAGAMSTTQAIERPLWAGPYIGAQLGWASSGLHGSVADAPFIDNRGVYFPSFSQAYKAHDQVFGGGLQLGYLYPVGGFVYGTEVSLLVRRFKDEHIIKASEVGQFINIFQPGDSFASKSQWQAAWIGRLGPQWQNWLWYGLGGLAFTDSKIATNIQSVTIDGEVFPASSGYEKKTLAGGTVGLGVEYALESNMKIGLEYRYTDFGRRHYSVGQSAVSDLATGFIYTDLQARARFETNAVQLRLNYLLD